MANVTFKIGDVVKRNKENASINGEKFGNGKETAVIERINGNQVWFTHGMWIGADHIELAGPKELGLREFLQALYDEEAVVSVDEYNDVDDVYESIEQLAEDICAFEISENKFYLQTEWQAYRDSLKPATFDYEKAIEHLANGTAVASLDDEGDVVDTYESVYDLKQLSASEIDGEWKLAE